MAEVGGVSVAIRAKDRPVDREIAETAQRQHGVVARRQLPLSDSAVARRIAAGRLHPLYRGVYAVGHAAVSGHGRWMAAVLACGNGAVLSHRTAGALWSILPASSARIDVVAARTVAGVAGITVHRPRRLSAADRAEHEGIPVTSVARTLVDLAGVVDRRRLRRAVDEAERQQLFDLAPVERLLRRGRHGAAALRAILDNYRDPPSATRSELERRFIELCRDAGLPPPRVNSLVAGVEVDVAWPRQRLVVELDGYAFHRTRTEFERDRERDMLLQLAGYRVVRITHRRLERRPASVLAEIRALLSRSPERPGGAPRAGARARPGAPAC
jgi:very-short-patch-repair endonuclease